MGKLAANSRFGFEALLANLLILLVVPSFFEPNERAIFITLNLSLILLSGLYLVANNWRELFVGGLLVATTLLASWWDNLLSDNIQVYVIDSLSIGLIGYAMVFISRYLFETDRVSPDMLYAALCLYLLIGLTWVFIYHVIETGHPGSFTLAIENGSFAVNSRNLLGQFSYYSYVTLSTLGYGDITPVTRMARSWSALEAIVGQLYLAVVLARVVALYTVSRNKNQP